MFGEYELLRELGEGGMGSAWLARKGSGVPVVVKRVLPQLAADQEALSRFLHEARVMARIVDECVVRTLELGEVNGEYFIAMEFVDGKSVQQLLDEGHRFTADEVRRIGADGAQGLLAAHNARDAQGRSTPVIHRDVSPHNLLVGKDGRARLIDFGVASLAGHGESGGKYGYAAPEQLLEDEASPLSDQYSLGVVLWECLAGRAAFEAEEDVEVIRLVTEVGVPPLPSTVDAELREVVTRMTALDPSARFASLRELFAALPTPAQRGDARSGAVASPSVGAEKRMTLDEAEARFGFDELEDLIAAGKVRVEDEDGQRYFIDCRDG